jgi:hypothetical protein
VSFVFNQFLEFLTPLLQFVMDSFFMVCCFNIGAHFEDLREQIHEIEKVSFIKRHQQILSFAKELNEIFRPIIFVEFLTISFVLCGVGVSLAIKRELIDQLMLLCYGSAMTIQLFLYCYSGQYLMNRTASVCDEVYNLNLDYKLIIMRAQKGMRIEAPFFRATLEQFGSILNTTWALISVIRSSMN